MPVQESTCAARTETQKFQCSEGLIYDERHPENQQNRHNCHNLLKFLKYIGATKIKPTGLYTIEEAINRLFLFYVKQKFWMVYITII